MRVASITDAVATLAALEKWLMEFPAKNEALTTSRQTTVFGRTMCNSENRRHSSWSRRPRSHASDSTFVLNIRIHLARRTPDATRHSDKNHDIAVIARKNSFERREFLSDRCDVAARVDAALASFNMWMEDLRAKGRPDDPFR